MSTTDHAGTVADWCQYMTGRAAQALRELGHEGLADHVDHLELTHAALAAVAPDAAPVAPNQTPAEGLHASPHCGCGVNDAGAPYRDPICAALPVTDHEFVPVAGHPDDDECTFRPDGTDATYCGRPVGEHALDREPSDGATPAEPMDLAAVERRAERHARLERDASRDITLAEVSAAIASADDVPPLLARVRELEAENADLRRDVETAWDAAGDMAAKEQAAAADRAERDRLHTLLGDHIDPATIPDQRARNWADWHPETYCHKCGRRNIWSWYADSAVWNVVHGGGGPIWCPVCFVAAHEEVTGQRQSWRLAPADLSDEVGALIRSEAVMRHERDEAVVERDRLRGELVDAQMTMWHLEPDGGESDAPLAERIRMHDRRLRGELDDVRGLLASIGIADPCGKPWRPDGACGRWAGHLGLCGDEPTGIDLAGEAGRARDEVERLRSDPRSAAAVLAGHTVSVDMSTGDHDSHHRVFGRLTGDAQEDGMVFAEHVESVPDRAVRDRQVVAATLRWTHGWLGGQALGVLAAQVAAGDYRTNDLLRYVRATAGELEVPGE